MVVDGNYKDGYHRINFENGVYEGMYLDDQRNGEGIKKYANGDKYIVKIGKSRVTGRTGRSTDRASTSIRMETCTTVTT